MTPTPQEPIAADNEQFTRPSEDGERIVISGMSGLFPQSHNVQEFSDLLYNKVDPSTKDTSRYSYHHPEMVAAAGQVPDLNTFDAQFFKIHYRLSNMMDPMARKLLEHAYQAIYDAGVNPKELSGKKVGVYIGTCFSTTEKSLFYTMNTDFNNGFGMAGCSKTMYANRISYWLNAKSASMSIDVACCSSTAALEQAYKAMKRGECEAAIVGGSFLSLHPQSYVNYGRIMKLCKDGKTKSFDENADGCGKSEAINLLFLQKAKDALRVYAEVLHVKTEFISLLKDETGPKYGFQRNIFTTTDFLRRFFEEAKVKPEGVEYVEAMGCGVPEVDKEELEAIEKVFCEGKEDTLLVGSVMSNIGYCEAATGISAITKVLLGYHTGQLAANLHCENPRRDVRALREGRMRIVTEHQPFQRGLVAVNGFSFSGVNSHVLLHGNYKPKGLEDCVVMSDPLVKREDFPAGRGVMPGDCGPNCSGREVLYNDVHKYKSNIPYLVAASGRTEEAVQYLLDNLKSQPVDPEQLALLHKIHRFDVTSHISRGYLILDPNETQETHSEKIVHSDMKRPLWFVYSGMGSQWAGMGTQLLRIPIFAAAIQTCHRVLEPKGINIFDVITSKDKTTFDNVLHSFVGIAAIQIGLTDVLRAVGLEPDGIIGHSVGELGCGYADGCLSAEEMILAAYSRGMVSLESSLIRGSMAAVGIGYKQISERCPPEIDVACHNSSESSTISGPADVLREFVAELVDQGVFAKEVPSSNIAYHSRYIAGAGPRLLKYLREVIKSPKARSKRWVSTSVPEDKWNDPIAQFCSPEYQTNNLLNPVLFEETQKHIPPNAVLVEIAPHGLLQAILKRSMPSECTNIAMTRRNHKDNAVMVLTALGELFTHGFNLKLDVLYPKVEFPVSTGTPFLSHLIKWAHIEKWNTTLYGKGDKISAAICDHIVSYCDTESSYLRGNIIGGKVLYPFAASLVLMWDTFAMILEVPKKTISVKFTDVSLYSQPILHDRRSIKLSITLLRGTGHFEILNNGSKVMTGYIYNVLKNQSVPQYSEVRVNKEVSLTSDDIYNLLWDKNYFYSGEFRSIHSISSDFSTGQLHWNNNWVTFIDGMLQLNTLQQSHDGVSAPSLVRSIYIDVKEHRNVAGPAGAKTLIPVRLSQDYEYTRCGGVTIVHAMFEHLPTNINTKLTLSNAKDIRDVEHSSPVRCALTTNNYKLECAQVGELESLQWVEAPPLPKAGIPVTVHYVAVNLDDMKTATRCLLLSKEIKNKNTFGMDFSGITDSGERVMGLLPTGAACRRISAVPQLSWPVPEYWSLEDSATVPLAYTLAYYCCYINFKILPKHTVYIHGGCGALGQAVISLALSVGCKVLTSVSNKRKKQFLCRMFPDLKQENIGYSRDTNFSDYILNATNGVGCDLVINTSVGDMKNNASKSCASSGLVIDLTQIQDRSNYVLGMNHLDKRSYLIVDLHSIFANEETVRNLQTLICHGISRGFVRPLSRVIYDAQEAPAAFRLLATSQHRGRVLLQLTDTLPHVYPRLLLTPDASHVVVCLDTFGLRVADMLVAKGAKILNIYYNDASNAYSQAKKRSWESKGVQVIVISGDISEKQGIDVLLKQVTVAGDLERVYFVTGGNQQDNLIIERFDKEFKKLNLYPKYFNVICVGDTRVAEDICRQRIKMGFNAVNLLMPINDAMTNSEKLDIVQRALAMRPSILTTLVTSDANNDLVKQVLKLSDICIGENENKDLTLAQLGLHSSKIPLIAGFLRNSFNVAYESDQISSLTINSLNQLQKELILTPYEESNGWSNFFKFVDPDELLGSTDIIHMLTLGNSSDWRDDEFNEGQTHLCIIPGMDGYHSRFHSLCERLKLPALVLQPSLDCVHDSLQDTARKMTKILLEKAGVEHKFYLLGYESGVILALEIAALLEEHGLTGTVFCLGYSPRELKQFFDKFIHSFATDEDLRDSLLKHMASLILGTDEVELVLDRATWESKVDSCVRALLGRVSHSAQYMKTLMNAALIRVRQLQNYSCEVPARTLRSGIVLLRSKSTDAHPNVSTDDLQLYSVQKVTVHQLASPLADVAMDLYCASIINTHLDPAIIEEFDSKSICNTYFHNGHGFVNVTDL